METVVLSNDFLQFKSSSLGYGKSLLPHWVNSLECYYSYYARALCKLMGASPMMVFGSSPVINLKTFFLDPRMTSAHICALRHVDNHILFTLAQQTICELVSTREGFIVTFWLGDGGLSDGMKKYKWCVRR